jgi:hypothetical protein
MECSITANSPLPMYSDNLFTGQLTWTCKTPRSLIRREKIRNEKGLKVWHYSLSDWEEDVLERRGKLYIEDPES